jgi:hypothetical protein
MALAMAGRLSKTQKFRFWDMVGSPAERTAIGGVGVLPIRVNTVAAEWEPCEIGEGMPAVIFPARDRPHGVNARLLDLIAFVPSEGFCYRRTGLVDLLGEWWAIEPPISDEPVRVFRDPCEWARANGAGVVLLDWGRARRALGHLHGLLVSDVSTGRELRRRLMPPKPKPPQIFVAGDDAE